MKSEMQLSPLLLSRLDLVIGILFERGEARLFMLSIGSAPCKSVRESLTSNYGLAGKATSIFMSYT